MDEKCHISRGIFCKYSNDMPKEFYQAYIAYMNVTRGVNYLDNLECVKKTINLEYWTFFDKAADEDESRFGLYLFLGIAIGAVFVIAILLLVIYLKRKGDDDEETTEPGNAKLTP